MPEGVDVRGVSGKIFTSGEVGVDLDAFEKQPKGSDFAIEYEAMRQSLPPAYRNNDALVDKAIAEYFSRKLPGNAGVVQKTQSRIEVAAQVVDAHKQELAAQESVKTEALNNAQAATSAPSGPSILGAAGVSPGAMTAIANAPGASVFGSPLGQALTQRAAIVTTPQGKAVIGLSAAATLAYYEMRYGENGAGNPASEGATPFTITPEVEPLPGFATHTPDPRDGITATPNNGPMISPPMITPNDGPVVAPPMITPNNGPVTSPPVITPNNGPVEGSILMKAGNPAKILYDAGITPPPGMEKPHAHHIIFETGIGGAQQVVVQEGQDILRKYGIDPVTGIENLTWAPNVKGQHTLENLQAVVNELKEADAAGSPKSYIIEVLNKHGELAAGRKHQ